MDGRCGIVPFQTENLRVPSRSTDCQRDKKISGIALSETLTNFDKFRLITTSNDSTNTGVKGRYITKFTCLLALLREVHAVAETKPVMSRDSSFASMSLLSQLLFRFHAIIARSTLVTQNVPLAAARSQR